jgi:hypothetical protein
MRGASCRSKKTSRPVLLNVDYRDSLHDGALMTGRSRKAARRIVTGGAAGIGAAIARAFHRRGRTVVDRRHRRQRRASTAATLAMRARLALDVHAKTGQCAPSLRACSASAASTSSSTTPASCARRTSRT